MQFNLITNDDDIHHLVTVQPVLNIKYLLNEYFHTRTIKDMMKNKNVHKVGILKIS